MEQVKSEGEEWALAAEDNEDRKPDEDTGQSDDVENKGPHQISMEPTSYHVHDWNEPFEIAIEDARSGEKENIQEVIAGGRRPRLNLGAVSRVVLDPEQPVRQQPAKQMKKTKKDEPGKEESSEMKAAKQPTDTKKNEAVSMHRRKTVKELTLMTAKKIWETADIHKSNDPELYVIYSMSDFVIFLIFLIITATIAFGSLAYAYNYHANVLSEVLTNSKFATEIGAHTTFRKIHRIQDIWLFMNSVLLTVLFSDDSQNATMENSVIKFGKMKVLEENIFIGAPQIRQVRVKNDTCSTAPMFEDVYVSCYDYYNDEIEDKSNFGVPTEVEFQYKPPEGIDFHHSGEVSSYGEGGFSMNFSDDLRFTKASLKDMERDVWIQIGSRAVFVDFTLYSANANLFCVVKLIFELIPAGGVVPSSHIHVLKLLRYVTPWDYFIAGCEVVFVFYVIYFITEECHQIKTLKEYYLTNWWNVLDFVIVLTSLLTIGLGIARLIIVASTIEFKVMKIHTQEFASFEYLKHIQYAFNLTVSILTFLVWFKLIKFSSLNRSVSLIISTFGSVKLELLSLVFMSIAVVMGFALLGNALFGSHVPQFRTVNHSFFTLVGLFIGGLYFYEDCRHTSRFLAQIFFVLYIFFVLVIFLSGFVALIVYGFHKAVNEIDDVRDRVYIGDVCNQLCLKVLITLKRKKLANKIEARQLAKLYKRDYDALLNVIRRHGYHGLDLALILKKHNVKAGLPITLETMSDVYNDLTTRNQLHMEVEEHDKILEHIDRINKIIEFLDLTLADIVTKVDILANKLVDRPATRK